MKMALIARPSTAFTLIEVMLAVAIAAIVLAAINTVFFAALRLRNRTTEATERTLPVESAVAAIKRDLLGTVPPGAMAGVMSSDTTTVGISQPVSLEFYTAAGIVADEVPWGDIQKVDYWLQAPTNQAASASGGKDLVRGVTRNLLATTQETPEQQVLIDNVQNLRFSYFDGTNWNDTWSSTLSNIPTAIKVFINFSAKAGGATNIPVQFVVPIITQASTNKVQAVN